MLATFVIGLREGLEAALIVGIIAAFLKQNGRSDALRKTWIGVGAAVVLCLAVGVVLQSINSGLPQRQQEMLECVVAAVAVVMVSYMVMWMRAHSRNLKSELHKAAGGALATGSTTALVVMAFLAVFREGFETAVFLLAAFQSAVSPTQAAGGAVLGVVVAVGLGYLIYRGGIKLNLSRFFRITGVVLVFVAAGLVMSTLRAAYEAGWLTIGQQHAVSLAAIARPGTVQESLLTGVLGIRSAMPVIEVVAYVLYLIPMLAVVLWPATRAMTGRRLGQVLAGTAAATLVLALGMWVLAPSAPTSGAGRLDVTTTTSATDVTTGKALATAVTATSVTVELAGRSSVSLSGPLSGRSALALSGHATVGGISAARYTGVASTSPVDAATAGLPSTLSLRQAAALNNGRLPVGLSTAGNSTATLAVTYTDTSVPTVTVDPTTGTVLELQIESKRSVAVRNAAGQIFPLGQASTATTRTSAPSIDSQLAAAAESDEQRADHEALGAVMPALLTVFAFVLLAFAGAQLLRRRRSSMISAPPEIRPVALGDHERLQPVTAQPRD